MSSSNKRPRKKNKSGSWTYAILFGLALAGLAAYIVYQPYQDLKIQSPEWKTGFRPDFPGLEDAASLPDNKKKEIVQQANHENCPCPCGYTLAACLKADLSCPLRPTNLERVSALIQQARQSKEFQ